MLAEERFALILDLLARQRTATVQELCEALSASESTIRRDLNELDKLGKLNKVHGGATLPDSPFRTDEPTMAAKETLAVDQKQSIAQAAASLVQPEDFVFLDAGSTTLAVARLLSGPALKASYVTNGVAHARLLAQKGCRVFLPGGLLRPQTEAIIGAAALTALQQYNFTKAFMGANGVALEAGFTTPDPEEAAVKAAAAGSAPGSRRYFCIISQFNYSIALQTPPCKRFYRFDTAKTLPAGRCARSPHRRGMALPAGTCLLPLHSPGNEPLNEQEKSAHSARRFPSENTSGY